MWAFILVCALPLAAAESQVSPGDQLRALSSPSSSLHSLAQAHGLASNTTNGTVTCDHCIDRTVPTLVNIVTAEISYLLLSLLEEETSITSDICYAYFGDPDVDCSGIAGMGCAIVYAICQAVIDIETFAAFNLIIYGMVEDHLPPFETCVELGYCPHNSTANNFHNAH